MKQCMSRNRNRLCLWILVTLLCLPVYYVLSKDAHTQGDTKNESQPLYDFGGLQPNGEIISSVSFSCFSHDGKHLIFTLSQKNGETLKIVSTLTWHEEHVVALKQVPSGIALSSDGKSLAVAGERDLTIWDTVHWQPKEHYAIPKDFTLATGFTFFPNGRMLLVRNHGSIVIFNGTQTDIPGSQRWGDIIGLAVSPSGENLALGGNGWLKILNTKTWRVVRRYQGMWRDENNNDDWVRYVEFSPDNNLLIAAAVNCPNAFAWRTANWHKAYVLHQDGGFNSVEFSSNSTYLLSTGRRSFTAQSTPTSLNWWSGSDGRFIGSIEDHFRHFGQPEYAFLSPDSSMIGTLTEAGHIVVWQNPYQIQN